MNVFVSLMHRQIIGKSNIVLCDRCKWSVKGSSPPGYVLCHDCGVVIFCGKCGEGREEGEYAHEDWVCRPCIVKLLFSFQELGL